jgi:cytidine deaminase
MNIVPRQVMDEPASSACLHVHPVHPQTPSVSTFLDPARRRDPATWLAPERVVPRLRELASATASRAVVPYSGRPESTTLLLSDGAWIPGVRVESVSFSLTIPALVNACSTAAALGRRDVVAVVSNGTYGPGERLFLETLLGPGRSDVEGAWVGSPALPVPTQPLNPTVEADQDPEARLALALDVGRRAWVPESGFPVGCLAETMDGLAVPGVNVEHPDWSRILCAERNALGTIASYGLAAARNLYLTCPSVAFCSPCGACRQLLAELAPDAALWMGTIREPIRVNVKELLPYGFSASSLARHSASDASTGAPA